MATTTMTGIAGPRHAPYTVVLNGVGEDGQPEPVVLTSELRMMLPADGEPVTTGPAGVEVEFRRDDPVAVAVWLRGATDVQAVDGPDLIPLPGDTPDGAVN